MGKYRILLSYSTGDSFGSRDGTDYLELSWDNLDIAKENLARIKEHYEMYSDIESYSSKRRKEEWFKLNAEKDWFVNVPKPYRISTNNDISESMINQIDPSDIDSRPDEYCATHYLKLKADNGNEMQMSAFWCGYFESLYGAEIDFDSKDPDMYFELN